MAEGDEECSIECIEGEILKGSREEVKSRSQQGDAAFERYELGHGVVSALTFVIIVRGDGDSGETAETETHACCDLGDIEIHHQPSEEGFELEVLRAYEPLSGMKGVFGMEVGEGLV